MTVQFFFCEQLFLKRFCSIQVEHGYCTVSDFYVVLFKQTLGSQ